MPAKKPTPARKRADITNSGGTTKIAALSVQRMSLDALKPHPRNPRKHPAEGSAEWQVLAASLKHDYFDPLVWNVRNGMLVSGHLRKKVLHSLGFTDADVVVVDYDEPTHIARLMAANKSIGDDDIGQVKLLLEELGSMESFDLSLSGFTSLEIQDIPQTLQGEGSGDDGEQTAQKEDDPRLLAVTTAIATPKIQVEEGSCWRVGTHVLFCQPLVSGPWLWVELLARVSRQAPSKVRFVPCPDPYVFLTEKDIILVGVQPDAFVAGHIVSNYAGAHGRTSVRSVSNPETLFAE